VLQLAVLPLGNVGESAGRGLDQHLLDAQGGLVEHLLHTRKQVAAFLPTENTVICGILMHHVLDYPYQPKKSVPVLPEPVLRILIDYHVDPDPGSAPYRSAFRSNDKNIQIQVGSHNADPNPQPCLELITQAVLQ